MVADVLSGRTHNGGFQERIICYILYKDDDYIAFLFRNKSILILIHYVLFLTISEFAQSSVARHPQEVYIEQCIHDNAVVYYITHHSNYVFTGFACNYFDQGKYHGPHLNKLFLIRLS